MVYISGVRAETSVRRVLLNKNGENTLVTVYVQLVNKGDMSFEIPDYKYYIRTSEGSLYPMELSKSGKKKPIHPGESKEIQLTSSIPAALDVSKGLELLFAQTITTTSGSVPEQIVVPIAAYELSTTKTESQTEGESVDFSTKDGVYKASFHSIQRLPWEDKDLIAADLSIKNTGSRSLPIPHFTGYFMLDDAVKIEASVVQTDDLTGFSDNSEIHFQALGKIAYNYRFSKVKFVLQEQDEDKATNDLAEFFHDKEFVSIPILSEHDILHFTDIGRHSAYSVKNVHTYTSETSDLFIVNLEMENVESRFVNVSNLSAFLKDSENILYPALVAETSKKIIPKGKALITMATVLPKGISKKGLQLLVGESVKGDKLASLEDTPDSFYKASAFEVPDREDEAQNTLKKIDIFPYMLSLSNFTTGVNIITGDLSVSFETDLSKDLLTETSTDGHKLIIEIRDDQTEVSFSNSIDLEKASSDESKNEGKYIKLGKSKYTLRNHDVDFISHVSFMGKYRLNLYDEYMGHKRLITSKLVSWFASLE